MIGNHRVLAVVPARSGSKGIADKNMRCLLGKTLLARAAEVLASSSVCDLRIISTDSERYAAEAAKHGLESLFLRPRTLSSDTATAVETLLHSLAEAERHCEHRFDVILIVEPTSPLRIVDDIDGAARLLVGSGADSVVTVSPLDPKYHPDKLLVCERDRLHFHTERGASIQSRQTLRGDFCWRNGACYALTRECLVEKHAVITDRTIPLVTPRPMVNIDDADELALAEFWLSRVIKNEVTNHAA